MPDMKYSFASYLKVARPFPGASDCVESYIGPGVVIGPVTFGRATAVGLVGRFTAGACPCPRPPPCPRPCPCCAGAWAIVDGTATNTTAKAIISTNKPGLFIVV